jgi:predicted chitinase
MVGLNLLTAIDQIKEEMNSRTSTDDKTIDKQGLMGSTSEGNDKPNPFSVILDSLSKLKEKREITQKELSRYQSPRPMSFAGAAVPEITDEDLRKFERDARIKPMNFSGSVVRERDFVESDIMKDVRADAAERLVEETPAAVEETPTLVKESQNGLMIKPTSSSQKEALSNMGSDINKARAYPIEIPTSTGIASNTYSRLELNRALDKSVNNPLKKALLQGTMDIEVGNQGPVTESAYYRLSKAREMFNSASVNRALASLSKADRQRANKNLPVEALGLALFDDVYNGGSNYRGRGLIQITGLSNYSAVQDKLADEGINVDLVNNPELVNSTKYALPAALAFLDYAGLSDETANTMSTKQLNNLINSGANAKIANERWDSVISSLKSAGKKEEAADMALRNEYKAQKKVGVTQDGSIGPISRKAMLSWLDKKGVTIRPDNDDDMELVKLVNRTK